MLNTRAAVTCASALHHEPTFKNCVQLQGKLRATTATTNFAAKHLAAAHALDQLPYSMYWLRNGGNGTMLRETSCQQRRRAKEFSTTHMSTIICMLCPRAWQVAGLSQ